MSILCRLFGHHWKWPEISVVRKPGAVQVLPLWRECERCGMRQRDTKMESQFFDTPAFKGNPKDCAFTNPKLKAVGEWFDREMESD
jgi:hypothetical protein